MFAISALVLQISTLDIMNIDDPHPANQSEDEVFTSRQSARHVCVALRRYLVAHLSIKAADIHRTQARSTGTSPPPEVSPYRVAAQFIDLTRVRCSEHVITVCNNLLLLKM